jgi:cation diffusion facilitator CzcD-associated flavoprotein CzcO
MVTKRQAVVEERPIDAKRPLRVICVGAGISGIITAIRFPQRIPDLELQIYEKNADITGTWFENRYPGCACGMFSHLTRGCIA